MNKKILVKVTQNIYGNFRGHVTGKAVEFIGGSEFGAKAWLSKTLKGLPSAEVSPLSYIKAGDLHEG